MKILIDNGHGCNTKGKRSPDGLLKEYSWAREIAARIACEGKELGLDISLLVPEMEDIPLKERVRRVNYWCDKLGTRNVVLVSVHCNAAGNGTVWSETARGFSAFVSKNASSNSKRLADIFAWLADQRNMLGNRSKSATFDGEHIYWTWFWTESDIYILKNTKCPAVLTENFFMDNHDDCDYLLSEEGKDAVVKLHIDSLLKYIEPNGTEKRN